MATRKISQLEVLTTAASNDELIILDKSDHTMGPQGTNKRIAVSNLPGGGGGAGTVTSVDVIGGVALTSTGGPITSSGSITVDLDNTAVTPGTYTRANITVDQQGRLTSAASSAVLDSTNIYRTGTTGDTLNTDLTAIESDITGIKARIAGTGTTTDIKLDANNNILMDSVAGKTTITAGGATAATFGSAQALFPGVRVGASGSTYDLPASRGTTTGQVAVFDASTNTSDWRAMNASDLAGDSDDITEGTTNLYLTSPERTKLTGIAAGAEVNQNAFSNFAVSGQTTVAADTKTDTLTLAASNTNTTITTDAGTDTVTIGVANDVLLTSVTTTGNIAAFGNVTGSSLQTAGNINAGGTLTVGTAIVQTLSFTGGGTSTIGPDNSFPTDPSDLLIRTNGNCDVVLDYDDDESSQAFRVKDGDGNIMFSVDEDGISVANGTASTGAVLRLGEATANGTNYVALQAAASLAANTTYTLPTADGTSGQLLSTDGSGTLSWATASGGGGTSYSTVRTQSGTTYTLALTDAGDYIQTTSTTAVTITVPLQSSVAWVADTEIYFEQNNTGQITIAGASGVTVNSSETLKSFARYSVLALKRVASDVWTLTGERALV